MRTTGRLAALALLTLLVGTANSTSAQNNPPSTLPAGYTVLYLTSTPNPTDITWPLLYREIYRQALLIAARDGLGLQTRDESLREWEKSTPSTPPLEIIWDKKRVNLKRSDGSGVLLWKNWLDTGMDSPNPISVMVGRIEILSRKAFVDALRKNGWTGAGNIFKDTAPAPADAESLLQNMDELSQFSVLRETHELIRRDGESPERLGVLVRAYANLSLLTSFHWSRESRVYAARALLYADRLVARQPGKAWAYWHRAYAQALVGITDAAARDLSAADAVSRSEPPPWVAAIKAFCDVDTVKLERISDESPTQQRLSMTLAFRSVEYGGCQAYIMNVGEKAVDIMPENFFVLSGMCYQTGPGMLNGLTEQMPQAFSQYLGDHFGEVHGLPRAVLDKFHEARQPGGNPAGRETVCQELIQQSDPAVDRGEPSWAALGRMIQEITFVQVRRRADHIANNWGIDASDYVTGVEPLIAEHPFRPIVEVCGLIHGSWSGAREMLQTQSLADLDFEEYWGIADLTRRLANEQLKVNVHVAFDAAVNDLADAQPDLECIGNDYRYNMKGDWIDNYLERLAVLNRRAGWGIVAKIANHWNASGAVKWEREDGDNPTVVMALGQKYVELNRPDDAERCFKKYVTISPDYAGYEALAGVYQKRSQDELWVAALKEFLQVSQDYGLEHANVQVQLGKFFCDKGEYDQALPWARQAGETGAGWASTFEADVRTYLGDFDGAEQLLIEEYQHYSESPIVWYLWCLDTGHGHRADAEKAMTDYVANQRNLLEISVDESALRLHQDKPEQALTIYRMWLRRWPDVRPLLHAVLLCDALHNQEVRDELLDEIDQVPADEKNLLGFSKLMRDCIRNGSPLDLAKVDALASASDFTERLKIDYFAGAYLEAHGQVDRGLAYYRKCCVCMPWRCPIERSLAYHALQKRGIDPFKSEAKAATSQKD